MLNVFHKNWMRTEVSYFCHSEKTSKAETAAKQELDVVRKAEEANDSWFGSHA